VDGLVIEIAILIPSLRLAVLIEVPTGSYRLRMERPTLSDDIRSEKLPFGLALSPFKVNLGMVKVLLKDKTKI